MLKSVKGMHDLQGCW